MERGFKYFNLTFKYLFYSLNNVIRTDWDAIRDEIGGGRSRLKIDGGKHY